MASKVFPASELSIKSDRGEVVLEGSVIDSDGSSKSYDKTITEDTQDQSEGHLKD
jgi:Flp pilus assembly secretin CpaC